MVRLLCSILVTTGGGKGTETDGGGEQDNGALLVVALKIASDREGTFWNTALRSVAPTLPAKQHGTQRT